MKTAYNYLVGDNWIDEFDTSLDSSSTLITVLSDLDRKHIQSYIAVLAKEFPKSIISGCSTAGQFLNGQLLDSPVLVTITQFEKSELKLCCMEINKAEESFHAGMTLAEKLNNPQKPNYTLVLSKGLEVNGSQLIEGFNTYLDSTTILSGGLAADNENFKHTWVINESGIAKENCISAIGFYGENINVSTSSKGGWDMIGIDRKVTRSRDNVLYELDNMPALELYKQYLGNYANQLPSSGLLFPLAIVDESNEEIYKVRTILAVNHKDNSITFAGDIPAGSMVRLMHANLDRIIDGAAVAAKRIPIIDNTNSFCFCVSCVGRKLILKQRAEEEIEAVKNHLNSNKCLLAGFYSYGELSPLMNGICDLHNQTMTITQLWET